MPVSGSTLVATRSIGTVGSQTRFDAYDKIDVRVSPIRSVSAAKGGHRYADGLSLQTERCDAEYGSHWMALTLLNKRLVLIEQSNFCQLLFRMEWHLFPLRGSKEPLDPRILFKREAVGAPLRFRIAQFVIPKVARTSHVECALAQKGEGGRQRVS
jgi:hypothetical protein